MSLSNELYMDKQGLVHLRGYIVIPTLTRKFRVENKAGWYFHTFDTKVEACQFIIERTK